MKKIVIVSYATYPGISPRQLRTNELAKELARQGHKVTLYVLKGGYNYESYEKETGIKVKDLGQTLFFKFNHKTGLKLTLPFKFIKIILGRFFEFPFIELTIKTYKSIKNEKDIDLLITIGSPHPIHWGAALLRTLKPKNLGKTTWVSDCGDPYMGNSLIKYPFYFKYIEKWFCRKTDFISVPTEEAKNAYYPEFQKKIKTIPQGFNFNDIKIEKNFKKNKIPTFIYAGSFYIKLRDPRPLLDYLSTINKDFRFIIYTKNKYLLKKHQEKLGEKLIRLNYIPREELLLEMSKSDFLVNIENPSKVQSPSKLIDYCLSGRPILNIDTNKEIDKKTINEFLNGDYSNAFKLDNIEKYNIETVANQFLTIDL
ncbi:MAG: glycosyltransferase family 4 protein [Candidatus Moranbacteria bacterium]|nr:glycosyltransferase family 4 protein [Candidatus Moranbacteria bacterium]